MPERPCSGDATRGGRPAHKTSGMSRIGRMLVTAAFVVSTIGDPASAGTIAETFSSRLAAVWPGTLVQVTLPLKGAGLDVARATTGAPDAVPAAEEEVSRSPAVPRAHARGATPRCRRLCRDEVRACIAAGGRPSVCRRDTLRRCQREGLAACRVTTTTTTTTTTTATICVRSTCYQSCGPTGSCPVGEHCIFPTGDCGTGGAAGICFPGAGACWDVDIPVCGCDGRTYSNFCYAAMSGVSVRYPWACGAP